jgi:hypothetical protein
MKTKFYTSTQVLLVIIIVFSSCRSVNKLYKKGDYDQAVYTGVKKIEKNKLKEETKELLASAYARAVQEHENNINMLSSSNAELKWEAIVQEYQALQNLGDAIVKSDEALLYIKPKNYGNELRGAIDNAVAVRKDRGLYFLSLRTKKDAQTAYDEFEAALHLDKGNAEMDQYRREAFEKAVTNIVITPIQSRSFLGNYDVRNLERCIIQNLENRNSNRFTKYYSDYTIRNSNTRVDYVMDMYYNGIDEGRTNTDRVEKNVQKDNVLIKEIKIRPDSIVREYGTVYAKYTEYKLTQNIVGNIFLTVRDNNTNRILVNRNVEATYCYQNQYARFTGDERALSTEQKQMVDSSQSNNGNNRLDERSLINAISAELGQRISDEVRYYFSYNNY